MFQEITELETEGRDYDPADDRMETFSEPSDADVWAEAVENADKRVLSKLDAICDFWMSECICCADTNGGERALRSPAHMAQADTPAALHALLIAETASDVLMARDRLKAIYLELDSTKKRYTELVSSYQPSMGF